MNGNEISTYYQACGSNEKHKNIEYGNYHIIAVRNHCFF